MALSDHEQQLFEQLERELRENDPNFAQSVSSSTPGSQANIQISVRKIVIGLVAVLVGLGLIIFGVSTKLIILGVLGFLVAAGGIYWATTADQKKKTETVSSSLPSEHPKPARSTSGFMKGLEDRWDNRQG